MENTKKLDQGLLLKSLKALSKGDVTVSMPADTSGMCGEINRAFNDVVNLVAKQSRKKNIHLKGNAQDSPLAGSRILVVDDDVRSLFAIRSIIEDKGADVIIAENGKHCLKALLEHEIDLLILDMMMPGMHGYEVMEYIRKRHQHESLPIIALTAKAMDGDREKCIRAGATDYISKPVDNKHLIEVIQGPLPDNVQQ